MNILIPMAGEGKRFADAGYAVSKPAIPTCSLRTGETLPMVVCAVEDLPGVEPDGRNVMFVERTFHRENGTQDQIARHFPRARFLTAETLTQGQACTCLLAEDQIDNDEPLLIAGCDNGMVYDHGKLEKAMQETDVLVFTFRHNGAVDEHPDAYGWMKVDGENRIVGTSIKKAISDTPRNDHAVVATFWFRQGHIFVECAHRMIARNDRIRNEFYVDQVVHHALELGYRASVFEIDRYISWGTPHDYENYQKTVNYWREFARREGL